MHDDGNVFLVDVGTINDPAWRPVVDEGLARIRHAKTDTEALSVVADVLDAVPYAAFHEEMFTIIQELQDAVTRRLNAKARGTVRATADVS